MSSKPKKGKDVFDRDQITRMRKDGDKKRKARGELLDLTGAKANKWLPMPRGDRLVEEIIAELATGTAAGIDRACDGIELMARACYVHGLTRSRFRDLCREIENEAVKRYGDPMLRVQINEGLRRKRVRMNGFVMH